MSSNLRGKRKRERPEQPEPEAAPPPRAETAPSVTTLSPSLTTVCRETMHLKRAYTLRNRKVFVPNTDKPKLGPMQYKKRPCRKEPVHNVSWQTPACAKVALEHYNRLNEVIQRKHQFVGVRLAEMIGSSILLLEGTEAIGRVPANVQAV